MGKMRTLENVTDDEIVDLVAKFGMLGVVLGVDERDDRTDWTGLVEFARQLGIQEPRKVDDWGVVWALGDRLVAMTKCESPRLAIPIDERLMLTPTEWARRLVGDTKGHVRALLIGEDAQEWERSRRTPATWLDKSAVEF